jgi:LPS-assembly lipoprotein
MRPKILLTAALCLGGLLLHGCGFTPLYGNRSPDIAQTETAKAQLAAVAIALVPDREGQMLRNRLLDLMNPAGVPTNPRYRLNISLTTTKTSLATRTDASVSLYRLQVKLTYQLFALPTTSTATETVLTSGTLTSNSSYNVLDSLYATKVAADDALARSMNDLAYQLTDVLAAELQRPSDPNPPQP